ncbi:hypothetical protein RSOLAG1IB_02025 [Rhizoctonia solani AG-1 IB]|uniref:Uncharacterized protein n=1 Tax=Thanatephorus cucumeris (strain AG1-IB / isolate 7/3/14) TaxID=1108050 RepID=A0A0B7FD87_THACB|nr:hypothetical protein RSOLAG1IB_02025 [Rhizoctonia solani AG-1 IB]
MTVNLGELATTIALASDALAAAAEALAEAAKAMSEASGTFSHIDPVSAVGGMIDSTKSPETPNLGNQPAGNNGGFKDSLGQTGDHARSDQAKLQPQRDDAPGDSPSETMSISSDSTNEVEVVEPALSHNKHTPNSPILNNMLYNPPQHELNNKLEALPQSPLACDPDTVDTDLTQGFDDGLENDPYTASRMLEAMTTYPTIPPGRNYIHLDELSDGLAFVAYAALQNYRTICVVPDQDLANYATLLESLTHAKVHRIETGLQFKQISWTSCNLEPASFNIFITPHKKFTINAALFEPLSPDCIIYWGQPSITYYHVVLRPLPPAVRTCAMIMGDDSFNGRIYGIEPYSDAVLNSFFHANSPLQVLRQVSSQLLPDMSPPIQTKPLTPEPPPIRFTPQARDDDVEKLPAGHFYIILDQANDIDIVPMVAYIGTRIKKCICNIPQKKSLDRCQKLIKLISNVNVINAASPKAKAMGVAIKTLKAMESGILMRNADSNWNSHWSKSITDCAIYWGPPEDLQYYIKECKMKVSHSFLVLTRAQYSSMRWQLGLQLKQHPHIQASDSSSPPSLYALRQKLLPYL